VAKKSFSSGIEAIFSRPEKIKENFEPKDDKKTQEIRATFYVDQDLLFKLKSFAHLDRILIKELVNDVFSQYIDSKGANLVEEAAKKYSDYLNYKKCKKK